MRVISGSCRGRRLVAPPGDGTRPTSDRVREALFSMLGEVEGLMVADLFAGSGALGIEALSRGAATAVFVDQAPAAVSAVRGNLDSLGLEGVVIRGTAQRALAGQLRDSRFDLVFLDPPYRLARTLGEELSGTIAHVLAPGARVVVESDRRDPLELALPVARERNYSDTLIRIYVAR